MSLYYFFLIHCLVIVGDQATLIRSMLLISDFFYFLGKTIPKEELAL